MILKTRLSVALVVMIFTVWPPAVWSQVTESHTEDLGPLIRHLELIAESTAHAYKLKDDQGRGMDCLQVFQPADAEFAGVYFGVYHHYRQGVLVAHLARSVDLVNWVHITALDEHASQPAIFPCDHGGYLLAYEHDEPNSVWIRIRYYVDLAALSMAKHQRQFDIARSLAPTAEGTPSFESVEIGTQGIEQSEIRLRFHYYKNGDVDQLAVGTLRNFADWAASPAEALNRDLNEQGWRGNLGDRDKFEWNDRIYYLQEIQRTKGDWGSWRLGLCDAQGKLLRELGIQTHQGSTAFSNPHATWVTDANNRKKLIVTLFLHSKGNPATERGVLLYVIDPQQTP
jgi:hypothetical protein